MDQLLTNDHLDWTVAKGCRSFSTKVVMTFKQFCVQKSFVFWRVWLGSVSAELWWRRRRRRGGCCLARATYKISILAPVLKALKLIPTHSTIHILAMTWQCGNRQRIWNKASRRRRWDGHGVALVIYLSCFVEAVKHSALPYLQTKTTQQVFHLVAGVSPFGCNRCPTNIGLSWKSHSFLWNEPTPLRALVRRPTCSLAREESSPVNGSSVLITRW